MNSTEFFIVKNSFSKKYFAYDLADFVIKGS